MFIALVGVFWVVGDWCVTNITELSSCVSSVAPLEGIIVSSSFIPLYKLSVTSRNASFIMLFSWILSFTHLFALNREVLKGCWDLCFSFQFILDFRNILVSCRI